MSIYTSNNYSLRRLLPVEWALYKKLRLMALQTEPAVFGSNFDKEFAYTDADWQQTLTNPARVFFALFHGDAAVGVTGAILKCDEETTAALIASFILPEHRGKGLSELFYRARLDWARAKKCTNVIVSHRASNLASKYANQKFGFVETHKENRLWPDGAEAEQIFYKLELN